MGNISEGKQFKANQNIQNYADHPNFKACNLFSSLGLTSNRKKPSELEKIIQIDGCPVGLRQL